MPTLCPETERNAYNAAFHDLGLRWFWDATTFAALQAFADPVARMHRYLETTHPHLLRAYDAGFLAAAIEGRKARFAGRVGAAPIDWAGACAAEVGA